MFFIESSISVFANSVSYEQTYCSYSVIDVKIVGELNSPTNQNLEDVLKAVGFACKSQRNLVDYKNWAVSATSNAAKGVLNPNEIHFMQSSIKNTTGEFTVLGNAEALANGSLNPNVLRMNVWKDASGRPILDIGLDATRTNPSIFYQMEQNMMKNYLKLHPNAFQIIKP